ncbi:hypothetical protein ACFVRR_12515 [Gottfriedia sp. NPDC057948]|uniref:hypothetical protein n=1 Tax=Gottfriedia sp. NPDC057948 TaxID=3346287 RepID=UPI0036DB3710
MTVIVTIAEEETVILMTAEETAILTIAEEIVVITTVIADAEVVALEEVAVAV